LARGLDLVLAQRGAVRGLLAGLVRRAEADRGAAANEDGLVVVGDGLLDRRLDRVGVVAVDVADHAPAVGLEARGRVVGEPALDLAVDRDVVVVPEGDQLAQAPGAGERGGLVRDALHQAAVAHEHPGTVVDDGELGTVEALREQLLCQREAHGVGEALAERAGRGLHARGHEVLGVAGGLRFELAEALDLLDRQVVAGQVQQCVLQHRAVPVGEHEAVAVEPLRVVGVMAQVVVPEHLGDVGHAHRHARMAGVGGLDGVDGEKTDGVGEVAAAGRRHGRQVTGRRRPAIRGRHIVPCPRGEAKIPQAGAYAAGPCVAGSSSMVVSGSPLDTIAAMPRSPVTLTTVRDMSRKWFTPRIRPMPSGGTPTIAQISATTGSEPEGTPAVPMPPRMQTSITITCWPIVSSTPKNWARKITVTPSNSAVPFWLAVAPMVSTKRDTRRGRPNSSSATRSAVGRVALLDAVEKA